MPRLLRLAVMTLLLVSAPLPPAAAQWTPPPVHPRLLETAWPASWIAHPTAPATGYGVYLFRKSFALPGAPEAFRVHVSADNRYRLFVNGAPVASGPAQSDLRNWRFETLDLAPYLRPGQNTLAAVVWNGGEYRPIAQITHRTGFVLQGDAEAEQAVNTDASWRVLRDTAYAQVQFADNDPRMAWNYYVAGGLDSLRGAAHPWGWEQPGFDDAAWAAARPLDRGAPAGVESHQKWQLTPRPVPLLEEKKMRFERLARAEGPLRPGGGFLQGEPVVIPPRTRAVLLVDNGLLSTGYPELVTSGGAGAEVRIVYAEALYDAQNRKGRRDQIEGKRMIGVYDVFLPDGGARRLFRPLWVRSYRYVQLEITTAGAPLTLEDFYHYETAYPAVRKAAFASDDPSLTPIFEAGWRTVRLNAQDVLVSDLYWERLPYIGDTKIHALAWYYMTGDDLLYKQALEQFDDSRVPEGLTQSRYPADLEQFTPLYALVWVTMVHDFWMLHPDAAFTRQFLPGIEQVLGWFERQRTPEGLIPTLYHLDFVDSGYSEQWAKIRAEGPATGSAVHSLFYAWTLDQAAALFRAHGRAYEADRCAAQAAALKRAVYALCWDAGRGLLSDTPNKRLFSQHANVMAILTDAAPPAAQPALLERLLAAEDALPVDIYFRFYLGRALRKLGAGGRYLELLGPWRRMIADGMHTVGEVGANPRSEAHPWAASPNYEFLAMLAGIEPAEPGFKTVRIAPEPGPLRRVSAAVPHPLGLIEVRFEREGASGLRGSVRLPAGLTGVLEWEGKKIALRSGAQEVRL